MAVVSCIAYLHTCLLLPCKRSMQYIPSVIAMILYIPRNVPIWSLHKMCRSVGRDHRWGIQRLLRTVWRHWRLCGKAIGSRNTRQTSLALDLRQGCEKMICNSAQQKDQIDLARPLLLHTTAKLCYTRFSVDSVASHEWQGCCRFLDGRMVYQGVLASSHLQMKCL